MKKKLLSTLIMLALVVLCAILLPTEADAATVSSGICGDNLTWTWDDAGTLTISGTGPMISYSNSPWDSILGSIKNVIITNGVTTIGGSAFAGCTNLTSIAIPDSVTSIGKYAFAGCTNLTSITIPDSVTSIGEYAFSDWTGLTSITIPDSVTSIGYGAFRVCTSLTSITIPDSVTSIDNYVFADCTSLTSVTIGNSVTSIGNCAFYHCDSLTSVAIGNSVASIGNSAFAGCDGLTSITIPDSVTSIGNSAFAYCDSLTSITIPDSVTSIGNFAFSGCTSLTGVTIPDSVTSIGRYAFQNCTSLTSVTIGNGVTSIGEYAFSGCTGLTSIAIPDSVTSIGEYTFLGCTNLTAVTIGNSVTSIGGEAFRNCNSLSNVNITDIAAWCRIEFSTSFSNPLYYTKKLYLNGELVTNLVIPEGVTEIKSYAFYNCTSLTGVTILDSVTNVDYCAFNNCTGLTSVNITDLAAWCQIDFDTYIPGSTFAYNSNPLYYAKKLYLNGELVTDLVIPEGVTEIGYYAFSRCTSLTSITIPDSVTSIGKHTFGECTSLTSVTIGNSVTSIGNSAFSRCTSLTSITIPDSVTSIGADAFFSCTSLTSVTIGNSVTSFGNSAFSSCTSLTSVTIGNSVTTIGDWAFNGCGSLTSITIPDSVTSIGRYAFSGYNFLGEIVIYYGGSCVEWKAIQILEYNELLSQATIVYASHNWDTGVYTPATATENGFTTYTCVDCGATKRVDHVIPPDVDIESGGDSVTDDEKNNILDRIEQAGDEIKIVVGFEDPKNKEKIEDMQEKNPDLKDKTPKLHIAAKKMFITGDKATKIVYDVTPMLGDQKLELGAEITFRLPVDSDTDVLYAYVFHEDECLGRFEIHGTAAEGKYVIVTAKEFSLYTVDTSIIADGSCGNNLTWTLDDAGTLTISGTGPMTNYDSADLVPWYSIRTAIERVVIENGVTIIGDYAFLNCTELSSAIIPESVTRINYAAFANCTSLETVYYKGSQAEWDAINIGSSNTPLQKTTLVYNYEQGPVQVPSVGISNAGLALKDYIGLQLALKASAMNGGNYDKAYYTFVQKNPDGSVADSGTIRFNMATGNYVGAEIPVMAWSMADTYEVTVFWEVDGVTYQGATTTTSIKAQAMTRINKGQYVDLCVAMLNYGAAVQDTFNHNDADASYLANADLTAEQKALPAFDELTLTEENVIPEGTLKPANKGLSAKDKIILQFAVKNIDMSGYEVRYTLDGGEEIVIPYSEFMSMTAGSSTYTGPKFALTPRQLRSEIKLAFYDTATGEKVYGDIVCSVAAFAKDHKGKSTESVIIAMMVYGDAALAAFG